MRTFHKALWCFTEFRSDHAQIGVICKQVKTTLQFICIMFRLFYSPILNVGEKYSNKSCSACRDSLYFFMYLFRFFHNLQYG